MCVHIIYTYKYIWVCICLTRPRREVGVGGMNAGMARSMTRGYGSGYGSRGSEFWFCCLGRCNSRLRCQADSRKKPQLAARRTQLTRVRTLPSSRCKPSGPILSPKRAASFCSPPLCLPIASADLVPVASRLRPERKRLLVADARGMNRV